jgi:predicted ester cyclase
MTNAADLHTAMFDAIQARDFDTLRGLFDSRSAHISGDGIEKRGPDPVVNEVTMFTTAFPDLTITIRRQHVAADTVSVIEYTFSGTHDGELEGLAPTGRKVSVVACSVLEADGDTIKREADYFDTSALMAQLGQ